MSVAAILLAAGESTRMGRLKQLLPWDGMPLIAWQVSQLREAGGDEIVVVLGHEADQIRPAVPAQARVVVNEAYRQGRATSLRHGAEAVPDDAEAVLVLSVDQPRPAWLSRRLIEARRKTRAVIMSPKFGSGFGHPILLDGSLLPELREASDKTLGLRAVIDRHAGQAESIAITNDAIDVNLNTPSDYESALAAYERGDWDEPRGGAG